MCKDCFHQQRYLQKFQNKNKIKKHYEKKKKKTAQFSLEIWWNQTLSKSYIKVSFVPAKILSNIIAKMNTLNTGDENFHLYYVCTSIGWKTEG